VNHRFKVLIRVGALAVIWSLWLCRNDKVFNDKKNILLLCRLSISAVLCSVHGRVFMENHDLFNEVSTRLEETARKFITQGGSTRSIPHYDVPCIELFHTFCSFDCNGYVYLRYTEAGCNP
jgi:hypothetical protein